MEAVELAPNEKRCSKCKGVKDKNKFYKRNSNSDKLRSICNDCRTQYYLKKVGSYKRTHYKRPWERDVARILKEKIVFPKEFWPQDCNYAKVKVSKKDWTISFNPILKRLPYTKLVKRQSHSAINNLSIRMPQTLLDTLEIIRPIYHLRINAGFVIQFYEGDIALLDTLEFWAKSGSSLRNIAHLSTYNDKITLADHLWPSNAEYVYYEKTQNRKAIYVDIFPVSRTGHIVKPNSKELLQYLGLEKCRKVRQMGYRITAPASKFINSNNIPSGDWDLKETLPSGALRFRLYKEREAKQEQEAN